MKKAILLCYHGSIDLEGSADTKKLTKIFQKKNKDITIRYGYLQNAKPSINDQLNTLLKKNFYRIMIIPGMIFSGKTFNKDFFSFIHIDCDTYESTKCVLEHIFPHLIKDSIILC